MSLPRRSDGEPAPSPPSRSRDEEERRLVADLLAGKPDAFQGFYEAWFPRVHAFAAREVGGDPERTRELTRRILRRVVVELPRRDPGGSLARWMLAVARAESGPAR